MTGHDAAVTKTLLVTAAVERGLAVLATSRGLDYPDAPILMADRDFSPDDETTAPRITAAALKAQLEQAIGDLLAAIDARVTP